MEKCSPKGRDCIEKNTSQTFNCNATCEGVHADVIKMEGKDLVELVKGEKIEELDKMDLQRLIFEYKEFKRTHVQHFRFNSEFNDTSFGQF